MGGRKKNSCLQINFLTSNFPGSEGKNSKWAKQGPKFRLHHRKQQIKRREEKIRSVLKKRNGWKKTTEHNPVYGTFESEGS